MLLPLEVIKFVKLLSMLIEDDPIISMSVRGGYDHSHGQEVVVTSSLKERLKSLESRLSS